ncbi:unnamed protein product [Adineta ricciae]|uniref:TIR domain-containing protein n=1 Tax=Adineta ricciae TaxID=249248 RepID=A0A813SYY8_ADIRI|nr:unnamed protein product [Adineta ricciae]
MYQFYPYQLPQRHFYPWYNQPYVSHPITPYQPFINPQQTFTSSHFTHSQTPTVKRKLKTLSNFELINLLNTHMSQLKQIHYQDQQQQLPISIEFLRILYYAPRSTLASAIQSEEFSLVRTTLNDILQQWERFSYLPDNEASMFHITTKVLHRIIKVIDDITLVPLWLSDSTLLDTIATSLTHIANTGKFLDDNNKQPFRHFTHLIHTYTLYQQHLSQHPHSNKDTFIQLLHPVQLCLTSTHFVHSFATLSNSLTTSHKFFLLKCPAFISSYHGSALEETMHTLLSTMLPHYVTMLDKAMPSCSHWSQSMIRCVDALLSMINHGTGEFDNNVKLVSEHLPLIDHVLRLVDEASLYENISETLSNGETLLLNSAMRFLVIMKNESNILAHMKESHKTESFLRLTSCRYEGIVLNAYTLLAYTAREEDIKTMPESDRLLHTIVKSLKTTVDDKFEKKNETEQLLEILKGLIQHEQIKAEISKQDVLSFLLGLVHKLTGKAHVSIVEILWSLTFHDESALILRSDPTFLKTIENISRESHDEALKKAADGLVWKLIREPTFLKKIAKQEEDEVHNQQKVTQTIVEEVITGDGQKQLVTTIKPAINSSGERMFQYDIMISYCHADKEMTYKIHKFLVDQGFKVWIDLDNMHGPAMSAMADAVENSEFVIMCMSDSYKQSTYCQAEAEYAFNCKRRLIPLIMRPKYRPDGWLGFLIGSRIYVDFGRFDFETACGKLMTEISLQSKRPLPSKADRVKGDEKSDKKSVLISGHEKPSMDDNTNILSSFTQRKTMSNFNRKLIKDWTASDVLDFLSTERLTPMMPLCTEMNGRALIQLYKMCLSQHSCMYGILNDELKSTYKTKLSIRTFSVFLSAVEQRLNIDPWSLAQSSWQYSDTTTDIIPQEYTSNEYNTYPDTQYDLLLTSNASTLDILRTIERYGLNYAKTAFS